MFVVRRAFRVPEGIMSVGAVVAPADVTKYTKRYGTGYIIEVTEQNFDRYSNYFKVRHGVEIPNLPKIMVDPEPQPDAEPMDAPATLNVTYTATAKEI